MGKLFEILAVESSKEAASAKMIAEAISTFKNKDALFKGKTRTLKLFGKTPENTIEFDALEAKDKIDTPVAATIPDSLNYMAVVVADHYDIVVKKELSNQTARADVVVEGVTLMENVPATFLLGLETKLKAIRLVLEEIPTRSPAFDWVQDENAGNYLYKTREPMKDVKTAKSTDHKMLPQPNANIPVTYVPIEINKNIGEYTESQQTGLINTADKARLLERHDKLLQAIKEARQRANAVDVVERKVGDAMMGYLFGAWYDRSKTNPGGRV